MKVAARFLIVFVGFIALIPGFFSAQQTAAGLAGTWSGRATKPGVRPYTVTVVLDGTGAGFIEYPSMKCGGTLHFVRKNGDALTYRETITHGKTKCSEEGRVDLLPSGNSLAWTWSAGEQKATATLTEMQSSGESGCVDCDLNYDRDLVACYRAANAAEQQRCQDRADEDARTCRTTCKQ